MTVQARAPRTQPMDAADAVSTNREGTTLWWLGMAGFLINSRGTSVMVDPLLQEFDMPILIDFPLDPAAAPRLDAVLITHSDNDHFSIPTCQSLATNTEAFHSTQYVATLMVQEGLAGHGHDIGAEFEIGPIRVQTTPADHAWQNESPGASDRVFQIEDCCGFWIETPDGTIWAPGDSRLIPEHHLQMPTPDAMLFDFSDSDWHFGLDGAIAMANAYPTTPLLLHHWGCVDAPDFPPFNGDPASLTDRVDNPERIVLLAPGQPYELSRVTG